MIHAAQVSKALLLALTLAAPAVLGNTSSDSTVGAEPVSRWHGRWYVASSAALGFEKTRLATAISSIGRMRGVQGFLLARSGYLVEEHYWRGGARDKSHNLKSASKSIISALIGIAIGKGYFRLDQPIADLLPQARALQDPLKKKITVHHLLTMTSGLESTSYEAYNDWVRNRDWITAALQRPLAAPPGTEYRYSTGNTHMLSAILAASTGKTTREFAEQELFRPMGVEVAGWQKDPNGIHLGGNNFSLLPRDAVKFGQLYLDGGRWRDLQLVPPWWIAASTRPTDNGPHETYGNYGYLWWAQPAAEGSFAAVGYGGQYILVSPRHDSVVVVLSNVVSKGDRWEARLFELLKYGVLDSLVDPTMPPPILLGVTNERDSEQTHESVTAIAAANVNLRAEPSLTAERLALIPEGSQLELLERDNEWVRGRINGRAGWLHWDYVDWFSLHAEESELSPVAVVKGDTEHTGMPNKAPHVATTKKWTIIDRSVHERTDQVANPVETDDSNVGDDTTLAALRSRLDRAHDQAQNLQALLATTSSLPRYRTTAHINFRRSPSLNGTWLRLIEPETEFQVLEHQGPWLKANIDGVEGWLHSDFVVTVESTPADAEQKELTVELSAVGESVRQLLARQQVSESEAAAAKRSLEGLERELAQTLARLQNVELERARLDRARQTKTEELEVSSITNKQRARELDAARKQIDSLGRSLQKEKHVNQALATDVTSLRSQFQSRSDQLAKYAAIQSQRGQELDAARAQIAKLEGALQQEQVSKQNLVEELGRIRDQGDNQRQRLEQLAEVQAQRTSELDTARTQMTKFEGMLQRELESKQNLVEELGRVRDQSETHRQQLEQLAKIQAQRTNELDTARTQITKFEGLLQQEQVSKQKLFEELIRVRDHSDGLRQQLERLEADREERTQALDAARTLIAKLEDRLQQEQAPQQDLAEELGRIRDQSDTQRQQLEALRADQEQRTVALGAAHKQIAKLEEMLQQERASKRNFADELVRLDNERQTLRQQLNQVAVTEQQQQVEKQRLTDDLMRLREEHRTQGQRLERLDAVYMQGVNELEAARAQISELEQSLQQERIAKQTLAADVMRLSEENRTQHQQLEHVNAVVKKNTKEINAARTEFAELERLRSRVREVEAKQMGTTTMDIAMSAQREHQGPAQSTFVEFAPKMSLAATARPPKTQAVTRDATADIDALVNAWAAAWSRQEVDTYLTFYAQAFRPADGATMKAWETLRRRRLTQPSFVEVSVADLEITFIGPGRAHATFRQAYRADHYQDEVLKTLELVREGDQWRIMRETSR